jgi:MFS family permease
MPASARAPYLRKVLTPRPRVAPGVGRPTFPDGGEPPVVARWLESRTLKTYPTGWYRFGLLCVAVLSSIIAAYEGQIAPVLGPILKEVHMPLVSYGYFAGGTVVIGGISAFLISPLADRYGRVAIIIPGILLTTLCIFAMATLVHGVTSLIVVRTLLAIVEGGQAAAAYGIVRDVSPRLSRAASFGFLTFAPVGTNWFASFVAGATLPSFHGEWRSQFWIMAVLSLIGWVVVVLALRDISPDLRSQVIVHEQHVKPTGKPDVPAYVEGLREAARYGRVWALACGVFLFLAVYFTVQSYGPIFLAGAFHYTPAKAAAINSYFWLANVPVLVLVGWLSDRIGNRKLVSLAGAIMLAIFLPYFIGLIGHPVPDGTMIVYTSLLGTLLGIGYGPWTALFSETLEDIRPALQASGWALEGLILRVYGAVAAPVTLIVATNPHLGWKAWFWWCFVAVLMYMALLATVPGRWFAFGREQLGYRAQPAPTAAAAGR